MIRRILWTLIAVALAATLAYLSRFWIFDWWGREGLFGQQALRPGGDLVSRWLRGSDLAPFDLLIWVLGSFALLTLLQKLHDWLHGPKD